MSARHLQKTLRSSLLAFNTTGVAARPFTLGSRAFSDALKIQGFTKTHEWIKVVEPGVGIVGISDFAQDKLGEVQMLGMPDVGAKFKVDDEMASIESIKTISQANAVSDCEIVEVNDKLEEEPGLLNSDPEGEGWIVKVKWVGDLPELLTREAYEAGTEDGSIPP
mmetsp:Transcript_97021/g.152941  ORF Transcript_97021/g.152941 Transcript_97021/m.152941 type:complete len:165 (+) Transcript_97021:1-495(+)